MSLKTTFHIILAVSVLLAALGGIMQLGLELSVFVYEEQSPLTLSVTPDFSVSQPSLACIGCSGNGGGPGSG